MNALWISEIKKIIIIITQRGHVRPKDIAEAITWGFF